MGRWAIDTGIIMLVFERRRSDVRDAKQFAFGSEDTPVCGEVAVRKLDATYL